MQEDVFIKEPGAGILQHSEKFSSYWYWLVQVSPVVDEDYYFDSFSQIVVYL